jgi:hypothetical protein
MLKGVITNLSKSILVGSSEDFLFELAMLYLLTQGCSVGYKLNNLFE